MADKIHSTRGIVLRNVKYGETSIIATVYTELFGLQSYLLNGVRSAGKKGGAKAVFFQPSAILDMEVYHSELRQINRVKEYRFAYLYKTIFTDVLKNGVAAYMVELLSKSLQQPETNTDLFAFAEDCFVELDGCMDKIMANFPVFFAVQLAGFFGFSPRVGSALVLNSDNLVFDIEDGRFTDSAVFHQLVLDRKCALMLSELMQVRHPRELAEIESNAESRRKILDALEIYYSLHLADFGKMKTLPVLKEILR